MIEVERKYECLAFSIFFSPFFEQKNEREKCWNVKFRTGRRQRTQVKCGKLIKDQVRGQREEGSLLCSAEETPWRKRGMERRGLGGRVLWARLISILPGRRLHCSRDEQFERPCSPERRFINLPPSLRSVRHSQPHHSFRLRRLPLSCTSYLSASALGVGADSLCGLVYTADATPGASRLSSRSDSHRALCARSRRPEGLRVRPLIIGFLHLEKQQRLLEFPLGI